MIEQTITCPSLSFRHPHWMWVILYKFIWSFLTSISGESLWFRKKISHSPVTHGKIYLLFNIAWGSEYFFVGTRYEYLASPSQTWRRSIDVSNYWSVGVTAVYCSTACSVTVSWTREAGGGAGCPPVQCTAAVICHHNTPPPALLTCHPRPRPHNHTTVSVRSLAHLNAEWVAFCI